MIKRDEMAELMHDDIIAEPLRQMDKTVIEGKIASPRTAPPARLLIADTDPLPGDAIERLEVRKTLLDKHPCFLGACTVFLFVSPKQ